MDLEKKNHVLKIYWFLDRN